MEKLSEGEWKLMELLWEGRSGELHPAGGPVPGKTSVEQEHHLHSAPPPVPQGGGGQ